MSREFRVSHAQIELDGLGAHAADAAYYREALAQSWVGGAEVERFGRQWRLSMRAEIDNGLWAGHMGFIRDDEVRTVAWNDVTKDFDRGAASSGVVVPFVVGLNNHLAHSNYSQGRYV